MSTPLILMVDDDRLVLSTMSLGLRQAGYEVREADCAERALALAADQSFDIAILDIGLPDMTGTELAGLLLAEHDLPAIFLSAYSESELVDEAVAKGGLAYLVKPIDMVRLVPLLESAMARARDLKALVKMKTQLEQALGNNRDTNTAVGVLMERCRLNRKSAFELLRAQARNHGRRIEHLARDILDALELLNSVAPTPASEKRGHKGAQGVDQQPG